MHPIADLHCDLLLYLQMKQDRTPYDPICRASIDQLKKGNVRLQTLAIFTYPKKGSVKSGQEQIEIFLSLPERFAHSFEFLKDPSQLTQPSEKVCILPAFENASGFCEEDEPIQLGLSRLQHLHALLKRILYISLTWDGENRFGGGVGTTIGLKEDGMQLLRWMDKKKIAVDLSHTSDRLATDILNFIDKHNLNIPVIASHSNFRTITDMERNLPDELAKEIIRRKGIIGFNFFSSFVGVHDHKNILKHVEHGFALDAADHLCFGADFFCDADFPSLKTKYNGNIAFFEEYGNASTYPYVLKLLGAPEPTLKKIASENFHTFLTKLYRT